MLWFILGQTIVHCVASLLCHLAGNRERGSHTYMTVHVMHVCVGWGPGLFSDALEANHLTAPLLEVGSGPDWSTVCIFRMPAVIM